MDAHEHTDAVKPLAFTAAMTRFSKNTNRSLVLHGEGYGYTGERLQGFLQLPEEVFQLVVGPAAAAAIKCADTVRP